MYVGGVLIKLRRVFFCPPFFFSSLLENHTAMPKMRVVLTFVFCIKIDYFFFNCYLFCFRSFFLLIFYLIFSFSMWFICFLYRI
jgi:hypothetical protein